jgi:PadR family transcriptional regulator, regulatory protein PadR
MSKKETSVRMSLQTLRVLEAFLENPTEQLAGAEVHQRCGIASGTLYPILLRLESAGWFVSQWECIDPSTAGRPRRRLYRLTSMGLRRASEVFASFNRGILAWASVTSDRRNPNSTARLNGWFITRPAERHPVCQQGSKRSGSRI